jgi:hypothetical protein
MAYQEAFANSTVLIDEIGLGNAHMIWALGLYMEKADLQALASEGLTDGSNDKKIDFIYLDRDEKKLIFAQGFYAIKVRDEAPANKASDLNTASAWLFSGDVSDVPENLRGVINDFRKALDSGEIESIDLLYIHNLHESRHVAKELQTVAAHVRTALGIDREITVNARELGNNLIQQLYASQESHIEVKDIILCPSKALIKQSGPNWEAVVLSVPGEWLHKLYDEHDQYLFSANYRGFLGISKRRKINTAIKESAENAEQDFWVYNNGITLLTLNIEHLKNGTQLTGVSVINGAQTTGSIGSVDKEKHDLRGVQVLCRIIRCDDPLKVSNIVKFNNTQNGITTWDQYSGDVEQKRIEKEFSDLGHFYSRKRGFRTINTSEQIGIEDVIQPLVAFRGQYGSANAGKNSIFERNPLYKSAFENIKARHILFVYSLARAIDERRIFLKKKSSEGTLLALEEAHLKLLRNLRFKNFLLALLAQVLEPVVGWRVDVNAVAFSPVAAKESEHMLSELVHLCVPVINDVLTFVSTQITADDLNEYVQRDDALSSLSSKVVALLYASGAQTKFADFSKLVSPS